MKLIFDVQSCFKRRIMLKYALALINYLNNCIPPRSCARLWLNKTLAWPCFRDRSLSSQYIYVFRFCCLTKGCCITLYFWYSRMSYMFLWLLQESICTSRRPRQENLEKRHKLWSQPQTKGKRRVFHSTIICMELSQEVLMSTMVMTKSLMRQEIRETDGWSWKKAYTLIARQVMSGFLSFFMLVSSYY